MTRRKLDCLKPNLQKVQVNTPAGKTPETGAASCGRVSNDLPQPPVVERCPMRAFKEMSGTPTSR